jgi:tRNA pseudouridine55 synthase
MATGVLVVAVGPDTRFLQYMSLEPKVYRAEITFGVATDTYDAEGTVVSQQQVGTDLHQKVEEYLPQFRGKITQLPPMYSAVKVAGKALYHYARRGEEAERKERPVFIEKFDLTWTAEGVATAEITCSGGTYVRSLAHDLGDLVGVGAHLSALHRVKVGPYFDDTSVLLEEVDEEKLVPLIQALTPMPMAELNEVQVDHVRHGRAVNLKDPYETRFVGLISPLGALVGVGRVQGNRVQPDCVLPAEMEHAPVC